MRRVLLSPLDWGLGHATRLVPVARELLAQGCEPVFAANGMAAALLAESFPQAEIWPLPRLQLRYGSGQSQVWPIAKALPHLLDTVRAEHDWLRRALPRLRVQGILSDNRYGLWAPGGPPSVFITHQLNIQTPDWMPGSQWILRQLVARMTQNFAQIWVPDWPEGDAGRLSGELARAVPRLRPRLRFVGPLSRFAAPANTAALPRTDLLVLLSGLEPQRSLLEAEALRQMARLPGSFALVRGLPLEKQSLEVPGNVLVFNHLNSEALAAALASADRVLCRSGYSSVMDMVALGRGACLVPTPGQTEQEYLARHLAKFAGFDWQEQRRLDLARCLDGPPPPAPSLAGPDGLLKAALAEWLASLDKGIQT